MSLRILTDVALDRVPIDRRSLRSKPLRRFIEAWVTLQLLSEGFDLANR